MTVRIVTDVESGNICDVEEVSKNRFECKMKPDVPSDYSFPDHHIYWFLMKIEGAKDQRVTVDIINCDWDERIWWYSKPVYSYSDPNDLKTGDWSWKRITNTFFRGKPFPSTFTFTQYFLQNEVWVAERFPYNYTYGQRYLESIEGNPYVKREIVGKTAEGRNIDMIFITDSQVPDEDKKGIWVYARAHAMEQEGSWVIQGMIRFLLSDDPVAATLRKKAIFVFIPILAPDAAYHGRVVNPKTGYYVEAHWLDKRTEENEAIWRAVERWINEGHSIDVCWSFHHPFSVGPFVSSSLYDLPDHSKREQLLTLNQAVLSNCHAYGFSIGSIDKPEFRIVDPEFKGRYIKRRYIDRYLCALFVPKFGTLSALYEINSHADGGNYGIKDLHAVGACFTRAISDYFGFKGAR